MHTTALAECNQHACTRMARYLDLLRGQAWGGQVNCHVLAGLLVAAAGVHLHSVQLPANSVRPGNLIADRTQQVLTCRGCSKDQTSACLAQHRSSIMTQIYLANITQNCILHSQKHAIQIIKMKEPGWLGRFWGQYSG